MHQSLPHTPIIVPSILSADMACLGKEVDAVTREGMEMIHVDVMDNHYVPNLTIGPLVVQSIHKYNPFVLLDVHLMIAPVFPSIDSFAQAGAHYISFHVEIDDTEAVIKRIREQGCKPGIAFSPKITLSHLEKWIEHVDLILIMSVEPGFGGQSFMPEVLEKAKIARKMIDRSRRDIRLEIDGGINVNTIGMAAKAGCDTFVAGNAIYGKTDRTQAIRDLQSCLIK